MILGKKDGGFLEKKFKEIWGNRPRTRYNLWRFIEGFKKGDKIVVPIYWGQFSVYELVSEKPQPISNLTIENLEDWHKKSLTMENGLLCRGESQIDLGFYWEVKPIAKNMSRKDFADAALTARMKYRMTNTHISDLEESVEKAITSCKKNKPINLYSNLLEKITPQVLKSLKSDLNDSKFEHLVKFYFERNGATEVYIPAKNESEKEGDADVIAIFEPIKTIIYAQVKFHDVESKTNKWAVEQIKDYRNNKEAMDDDYTNIAWVITSANGFTENCKRIAQEEKVHLIDGNRFAEMIIEAGILELNKTI